MCVHIYVCMSSRACVCVGSCVIGFQRVNTKIRHAPLNQRGLKGYFAHVGSSTPLDHPLKKPDVDLEVLLLHYA